MNLVMDVLIAWSLLFTSGRHTIVEVGVVEINIEFDHGLMGIYNLDGGGRIAQLAWMPDSKIGVPGLNPRWDGSLEVSTPPDRCIIERTCFPL
jgi:hypothetical protein